MNPLRSTCIEHAQAKVQDCLVIGAGINGAVSAAAMAGKGVSVTVIDRGDFASFTSQESSNLAWGGIKYLENFEFPLVWGLCRSRNELMAAYPSQVQEIRFFTSIAKGFRKPRFLIYLGTLLYWFMGRCKTRPPRLLSPEQIGNEADMIETSGLTGGLEYSDCFFADNDTRFSFGFIRKVLQNGSNAINYMELVEAEWINGQWRCILHDHIANNEILVHAKTIVNAAGPYADRMNDMLKIDCPFKHIFSKGAHIIVPQITPTRHVLTFFASDGRLFFMIPMGRRTCIGTTDTRVDREKAEPTADDVSFLLANANALLKLEKPLTTADVIAKRCGVRPLVVKKQAKVNQAEWTALSRKHEVDVHPEKNLCSIYGGKLTDCINVGEEISEIIESFGIPRFLSLKPWHGEPGPAQKARFEKEAHQLKLSEEQAERLWRLYGKDTFSLLRKIKYEPALATPVFREYLRAELQHIAENEMVLHLDDFLRRRTHLALTEHRANLRCDKGLVEAAKILFGDRAHAEIEHYFSKEA